MHGVTCGTWAPVLPLSLGGWFVINPAWVGAWPDRRIGWEYILELARSELASVGLSGLVLTYSTSFFHLLAIIEDLLHWILMGVCPLVTSLIIRCFAFNPLNTAGTHRRFGCVFGMREQTKALGCFTRRSWAIHHRVRIFPRGKRNKIFLMWMWIGYLKPCLLFLSLDFHHCRTETWKKILTPLSEFTRSFCTLLHGKSPYLSSN